MPINALVELYEKASPNTSANGMSSSEPAGALVTARSNPERGNETSVAEDPKPRLARFIRHPLLTPVDSDDPFLDRPTAISEQAPSNTESTTNTTTITTDTNTNELNPNGNQPYISQIPTTLCTPSVSSFSHPNDSFNDSTATLAPLYEERDQSDSKHTYPPTCPGNEHNEPVNRLQGPHNPVPATVVFARDAFPLSLPKLDRYLSSLPPPRLGDEDNDDNGTMFPPLDQLAKTKKSLDDLESNSIVAPAWRNSTSIINTAANLLISLLGSSALASFYSLTGLVNTVQIFALILSTIVPASGMNLEDTWRKLFLGTIPNILALNFAPAMVESLIFLAVLMTISSGLLFYFYRATSRCDRYISAEGLQQIESSGKKWGLILVTFLLTVLYLPLCTMSVHVLVWSQELWPIPNPYVNATSSPPALPPLGPATEYRDPLDFCWTTTMKRNEINFAPIAVAFSAIVFVVFALWFPIALRHVIRQSVPKVDKFTELGRPRGRSDKDGQYRRLLDRDTNPFAFLYKGFRRGWGTYFSTYLFAKLSTLVVIAVIDPDNCLFRSFSRTTIPIVRQSVLLCSTLGFFISQCIFAPFLDPVNNASEWTSRLNYLSTSVTALLITLNISQQAKDILNSYVLYCIYIITYGLSFYFTIVTFDWAENLVKKLTRRIDFSIDIFSPRLDISSSSAHTKRRIWQEAISALLLTNPDCAIPKNQVMAFAQARDSEFPPYLLNFLGSPGERHVENLKIYREVGAIAYNKAVRLITGPDFAMYRHLEDVIQKNYIGPDSYWKKPGKSKIRGCRSHFGNAWWIPFPPTLVIRYDEGPYAVLQDIVELDAYVSQNSSRDIERRRYVRMALRALEGRRVRWPYDYVQPVGSHARWWCCGQRYSAVTNTHYEYAILGIKRRGHLQWGRLQLGSGFDIQLEYSRKITLAAEIIGLNEDFDLTSSVARFLEINRDLIDEGLFVVEENLSDYRRYLRKEFRWKARVLTYGFLTFVYDRPRDPCDLAQTPAELEHDSRVCQLMECSEPVLKSAYARLTAVSTSKAATWWYIFWDDLWRRNHDTISGLDKHAADFNPHYRTSIAYTPLPRPVLETFLTQRGLLNKKPRWSDFFHAGFLNKLYLRLNDAVFRDSGQAIMFHFGSNRREMDMEDIDMITQGQSSTLGTGGGTDHDDSEIQLRPAYRWEGLLNDPPHKGCYIGSRKWRGKLGAWLGITPLWRTGAPSNGISLDVKLENDRYVLLDLCHSPVTSSIPNGLRTMRK
ncbi:hypothetical protein HYPSUDRAFT_32950 [Hypholoma sublateritium FD-334 SS-4]|uniref:Uncharacterized protein n=1 Tax=Hypholoma sublateritium (strain FD-334 SS-4) TaxID=945553 RepID=A0A0D2LN03_HYPSF|nr:hypothetical protein HYPSUDRAFT_32950 [Hypholoma sublateritium FD-334 SS-4]